MGMTRIKTTYELTIGTKNGVHSLEIDGADIDTASNPCLVVAAAVSAVLAVSGAFTVQDVVRVECEPATVSDIRSIARANGLKWIDVVEARKDVEKAWRETSGYDYEMEVRKVAWEATVGHGTAASKRFRHGFAQRFRSAIAKGGDYTAIPGYDSIAQQVAAEFREFANNDDSCSGTERLFDLLLSPNTKIPTIDLYREALDMVAHGEYHDHDIWFDSSDF